MMMQGHEDAVTMNEDTSAQFPLGVDQGAVLAPVVGPVNGLPAASDAGERVMISVMSARQPTAAAGMVLPLTSTGVLHFAVPASFDAIVPEQLPGTARTWTHVTGVAELVIAALIATPRTRRLGGLLAALLFVGVFPANVKMAIDWSGRPVLDACAGLRAAAATDPAGAVGPAVVPPRQQTQPVTP